MKSLYRKPNSICILRLSAIGDVCHAIASVQALQLLWPEAQITWVIGKIEYQLVKTLPGVQFVIFDKSLGLKSYSNLRAMLKNQNFDILLHMQIALRASLASLCIRANHKWGFHKHNSKELQWLFTNHQIAAIERPHVCEGFWAFVTALSKRYETNNEVTLTEKPTWQITIGDDENNWLQHQLETSFKEDELSKPILVISPAASKANRNWLNERYAAVAEHAISKGYNVVLTGSPSMNDIQQSKAISAMCSQPIEDLTGKTSLLQLLALLQHADIVLTPDSGPAHMASIVNTTVIGLYAYSNPSRTGPYHSLSTTVSVYKELVEKQSVQSIEDVRWGTRLKGDDLMEKIPLEKVLLQFDKLLKKSI